MSKKGGLLVLVREVNLQVNVNSGPFEVDVGKGTVGCGGRA